MKLRTALPLGTTFLILSACSGASNEPSQNPDELGTAGSSVGGAASTATAPVGGQPPTAPTSTGTVPTTGNGGAPATNGGAPASNGGAPVSNGGSPISNGGVAVGGAPPIGGPSGGTASGGVAGAGTAGAGTAGADGNSQDGQGKTVSIKTADIPLTPGEETVKCQNYKNPIGSDAALLETDSVMISSHHMFVFHDPSFDADTNSVADCSGIEFHDLLHMSQTPTQAFKYPDGVARKLVGTDGLRILVHLLNTSPEAETASVTFTLRYTPPDSTKKIAVSLFLNDLLLSVPVGMSTASRVSGPIPADINMIAAVSHMHSRATKFVATASSGEMIYTGTDWNEPAPHYFTPNLALKQGTTFTWSCTYNNTTGATLTFGESANTNEMCILAGVAYPNTPGQDLGTGLEWVI